MNSELLYLLLFGLMMAVCCYHMMRMMMKGDESTKRSDKPIADVENAEVVVRSHRPRTDDLEPTVSGHE